MDSQGGIKSRVERAMKGQELVNKVVMEWKCCKYSS